MRFSLFTRDRPAPGTLKPGKRIYAIGDIHGRLDRLQALIAAIEADVARRDKVATMLIVLGDFIDRGPHSAEVLRLLRRCGELDRIVTLKGNHEAAMIDALRGAYDAMAAWIAFGGDATLASYGVDRSCIDDANPRALVEAAQRAVPAADIAWLDALPVCHEEDGYYFVHAGVRPGVALGRQSVEDRLWIRETFTDSDRSHGAVVVHGHSVDQAGVVLRNNRIGVDTGAGYGGVLSAVALEGDARWVVDSRMAAGASADGLVVQ